MKCPERKKIVEEKRKTPTTQNTNQNTYSDATKKTTSTYTLPEIKIDKDTPVKILPCILHAHISNIGEPGTYNKVLEETLKCNNLPTVIIPHTPPSKKIMEMAGMDSSNTTHIDTTNKSYECCCWNDPLCHINSTD